MVYQPDPTEYLKHQVVLFDDDGRIEVMQSFNLWSACVGRVTYSDEGMVIEVAALRPQGVQMLGEFRFAMGGIRPHEYFVRNIIRLAFNKRSCYSLIAKRW